MNLTKVRRGICVYHFSVAGSCPWKNGCMYTHDIPPEALTDREIIQDQKRKMQEITGKIEAKKSNKLSTFGEEKGDRKKEKVVKWEEKLSAKQACGEETVSLKKVVQDWTSHSGMISSKDKKSKRGRLKTIPEEEDVISSVPSIPEQSGGDRKSHDSFLELIRPMIMDQMKEIVHQCVEPYVQKTFQNVMANQLTLI